MINSFYLEFEPLDPAIWKEFKKSVSTAIAMHNIEIITFETGLVNTPDRTDLRNLQVDAMIDAYFEQFDTSDVECKVEQDNCMRPSNLVKPGED